MEALDSGEEVAEGVEEDGGCFSSLSPFFLDSEG